MQLIFRNPPIAVAGLKGSGHTWVSQAGVEVAAGVKAAGRVGVAVGKGVRVAVKAAVGERVGVDVEAGRGGGVAVTVAVEVGDQVAAAKKEATFRARLLLESAI